MRRLPANFNLEKQLANVQVLYLTSVFVNYITIFANQWYHRPSRDGSPSFVERMQQPASFSYLDYETEVLSFCKIENVNQWRNKTF